MCWVSQSLCEVYWLAESTISHTYCFHNPRQVNLTCSHTWISEDHDLKILYEEVKIRRPLSSSHIARINGLTRTHSMARHRKSPRSRRNLMVIDPLTPSQGHQFDHRLKFISVSWSLLIPLNLICHMTMFRKFDFWPLPKPWQGPRGWGPKNCAGACAIHVSNSHTKPGWILEKKILTPPHGTPKSHPWAWPRLPNKNPAWYVIYLSIVRRHTKFGLKTFEIDLVIQI